MCVFCKQSLNENEDEIKEVSGGDGSESVMEIPKIDDWGFEVDGNKLTKVFPFPETLGDIEDNLPILDELKKKMNKLGLDLTYSVNKIKTTTKEINNKLVVVHMYKIVVEYTAPSFKHDGFDYVLTLEKSDAGNFVFPSNEFKDESFDKYYSGSFICDLCKSDRLRNVMHVFRKAGEDFVFGTTCAKKYFGIDFLDKIRKAIWAIFTAVEGFGSFDEKDEFFGGGGRGYDRASSVFSVAFMWFTKNPVYEKSATSNTIHYFLHPGNDPVNISDVYKFKSQFYDSSDNKSVESFYNQVADEFKSFLTYYNDMRPINEFQQNMKMAALANEVKRMGMFVYAVYTWFKDTHTSADKVKENIVASEYIGNTGDKLVFGHVQVMKLVPYENAFGSGLIHLMVSKGAQVPEDEFKKMTKAKQPISTSDEGKNNLLVWYTSSNSGLEEGLNYVIKATINKHNDYKDKKQTVVKLVKKLADIE